ncbi:MAG: hypothetical protein RL675_942 [Bacteroidota bacterium]|jgi:hypothetical protein
MSNEQTKIKVSKRRLKDDNAVRKQVKIAKAHGLTQDDLLKLEPHKYAKHHAMNCGQPGCMLCGNPRKIFNERTIQERKFMQDVDHRTDKHSNGIEPSDE